MSRSSQRAAVQRAHFEECYRAQAAQRQRFGNAAEIVEDVPTLTDVVQRGGAAAARRPHKPKVAGSNPALATLERDVLRAVLQLVKAHPLVAWAERMNVGGMTDKHGQFVRFGFVGLSDIIGQMRDARFLAIECKRADGRPTQAQIEFLGRVQRAGGVAFVARSVDDALNGLGAA